MTTDTTALQERIARALYENAEYYGPAPTQPPWDSRDGEERGEWMEIAAAVLPIVVEEVRKAKAEAWDEPTDAEVEAAKAVLDSVEYADEPQSIRAALSAARAARRYEEKR